MKMQSWWNCSLTLWDLYTTRMCLQKIPFFTGFVKEQTQRAGMHFYFPTVGLLVLLLVYQSWNQSGTFVWKCCIPMGHTVASCLFLIGLCRNHSCRYRTICESNRTIRFDSGQNQGESQIVFDCVRIAESRREYMNRMKTWVSRRVGSYLRPKTQKWLAGKASKPLLESMELKTRLRSRFFHIWFETRRHQLAIESSISWVKAPRHHHHSRIDQRSTHVIV